MPNPVAPVYVEAPPITPLPFGLLSVSGVDDNPPAHWGLGVQYEPQACVRAFDSTGACAADPTLDFTYVDGANGGVALVVGSPFSVYAPFRCAPIGRPDQKERALEALRLGEQRAVERVMARLLPAAPNVVDVTPTPGTAVDLENGVAMLEQYAAINYGGIPTLHMARGVASVATTRWVIDQTKDGARLETKLGTRVAAGAGYDLLTGPPVSNGSGGFTPGSGPTATTAWVYVTGTVMQFRGTPFANDPFIDTAGSTARNRLTTVAQREYALTWECVTAAVLVSTPYAIPTTGNTPTSINGGGA